jgi:hypothetical protein
VATGAVARGADLIEERMLGHALAFALVVKFDIGHDRIAGRGARCLAR